MAAYATVVGNLGKEPSEGLRKVTGAKGEFSSLEVSVASRREGSPKDNPITDWTVIKATGSTADFISNYFHKGDSICINGNLQTDQYEKDGQKRSITYVKARSVDFVGSKSSSSNNSSQGNSQPQPAPASGDGFMNIPEGIDDELPFN